MLYSGHGGMSDNDVTLAVLSENAQLFREYKLFEHTVGMPRDITVVLGSFSLPVYVPPLYSSATLSVAQIPNLALLAT